ncbi:MAG: diguanylate cyclase [Planctomycetota bacterium]|nr:diguanylate cyclase [Planctomycetota bacterium]
MATHRTPPPPPPPPEDPAREVAPLEENDADDSSAIRDQYLRESGQVQQEVIEIAARDVERDARQEEFLAREKAVKRETFYSDLIYTLTHLRYEEAEARVLWVNLLTHKMEMSDRLGRNVGIRVAALDYFKNILGALDDVKILDASQFIETAQLAVTDGLTGVFNHRYFQDRLLRDINRAKEENGRLTLLMIDIDHFKKYNDVNGHIAGDVALKEVAAVLRRNLKRNDLVARYGGEEFAVILVGIEREKGRHVAERIRQRIEEIDFPNEKILPTGNLTISVGLAEFPGDAPDRGDLIAAADRALYAAKHGGRNRVELAQSDKRHQQRVPMSLRVRYTTGEDEALPPQEARTANLSLGGMCILTEQDIEENQILKIHIDGLASDEPLLARVMWSVKTRDGRCQVGVKFVNLGALELDRITDLVSRAV